MAKMKQSIRAALRAGSYPRGLCPRMAGVPEMSWKRSFDLCTANPPDPSIAMHYRAYRDFLQRNFPERLRELESAHTPDDVTKILRKVTEQRPCLSRP